jgi:hypothetical protein
MQREHEPADGYFEQAFTMWLQARKLALAGQERDDECITRVAAMLSRRAVTAMGKLDGDSGRPVQPLRAPAQDRRARRGWI